MKHSLRQIQCFECSLCDQLIFDSVRLESIIRTALFGAIWGAICPKCGQETNRNDKQWMKKLNKWVKSSEAPKWIPGLRRKTTQ